MGYSPWGRKESDTMSEAMDFDSSVAYGICVLCRIRGYKPIVSLFLANDESSGFVFSQFSAVQSLSRVQLFATL